MKPSKLFNVVISAFFLMGAASQAALPTSGASPLNAALLKLFGDFKAFSALADVRLLDTQKKETLSMTMKFALLDGMMRAEVDMSQLKSSEINAAMLAQFKQLGMDKVASVMVPSRQVTLVIYPELRSYTEVPMPAEDSADIKKQYQVSKTKLGKETVAGHPCEKTQVVLTAGPKERHEATVWYATDMKNFPLQMQMTQNDGAVVITYRNVQFARPDTALFQAPAQFTRHASMDQLMQAAMAKMLGGGK